MSISPSQLTEAARAIAAAEALVVTAGAGMGVDSGLPDFRGRDGFWRAYPPLARLGLNFEQMANPVWFERDPALAWGFYGHRFGLYRRTTPHTGFAVVRRWLGAAPRGGFVFTSNVDGHFRRAGVADEGIVECHGSLEHWQCTRECGSGIWPAPAVHEFRIDAGTLRAERPWPRCARCGSVARPNLLMFDDLAWRPERTQEQETRWRLWRQAIDPAKLVVVELGAGSAIATVRHCGESLQREGATLIRINPREADGPPGTISLRGGARETLERLDATDPLRARNSGTRLSPD